MHDQSSHAVANATPSPTSHWTLEEKIALSCRMLAEQGHSETLAGQLTVRCPDNTFLTT